MQCLNLCEQLCRRRCHCHCDQPQWLAAVEAVGARLLAARSCMVDLLDPSF